ncbi:MAG: ABC transporter ATP-binding protein, partial [Spirosomaceae bacterium]|nr:ABC transporter ATP-binding protein [Spirosomataceae bacterium]
RIFAKAAFEFSYRLPRVKTEAFADSNPPELMNRFFDVLTVQKTLPKVCCLFITRFSLRLVW